LTSLDDSRRVVDLSAEADQTQLTQEWTAEDSTTPSLTMLPPLSPCASGPVLNPAMPGRFEYHMITLLAR
jgi:hypothetical protein